jgi:pimeloyl-ACP methyl ester carboxylesterase
MGENSPRWFEAGSGDPLLLLHGFTATWQIWRPVLADLVARFHVMVLTLPGQADAA